MAYNAAGPHARAEFVLRQLAIAIFVELAERGCRSLDFRCGNHPIIIRIEGREDRIGTHALRTTWPTTLFPLAFATSIIGATGPCEFLDFFLAKKAIFIDVAAGKHSMHPFRQFILAQFAITVFAARQFVSHGHVKVNGKRVTIASIQLKVGDVVEVSAKAKEFPIVMEALATAERDTPDYIETNGKDSAKLTRIPSLTDVPYPVQMQPALVVEFYSR